MKTKKHIGAVMLVVVGCLYACNKDTAENAGVVHVALNYENAELYKGDVLQLVAVANPDNVPEKDKAVSWRSEDQTIATVDETGLVSGIAIGRTRIFASAGGKENYCNVSVQKKIIPVSSVTLNESCISLEKGKAFQLVATIAPEEASDTPVSWESENPEIASVDNGLVTAKERGTTFITVASGEKFAKCLVIIEAEEIGNYPVSSYKMVGTRLTEWLGPETTVDMNKDELLKDATWIADWMYRSKDGDKKLLRFVTGEKVTYVGTCFIYNAKETLLSLVLSEGLQKIGPRAFHGLSLLTEIKLPSTVTVIETQAFRECLSLKSVEIPNGVTEITAYLFNKNDNLERVRLGNNIKKMGESVFFKCYKMQVLEIATPEPPTDVTMRTFEGSSGFEKITLRVPIGSKEKYAAADVWKEFVHIEEKEF